MIFAVLSSISCIKAEKVTVTVTNAGELSHAIESVQETAITNLTIKGKLGGTDLAYIRTMKGKISSLEELDLKDVTLVDDGEPYYHYSFSPYYPLSRLRLLTVSSPSPKVMCNSTPTVKFISTLTTTMSVALCMPPVISVPTSDE